MSADIDHLEVITEILAKNTNIDSGQTKSLESIFIILKNFNERIMAIEAIMRQQG